MHKNTEINATAALELATFIYTSICVGLSDWRLSLFILIMLFYALVLFTNQKVRSKNSQQDVIFCKYIMETSMRDILVKWYYSCMFNNKKHIMSRVFVKYTVFWKISTSVP